MFVDNALCEGYTHTESQERVTHVNVGLEDAGGSTMVKVFVLPIGLASSGGLWSKTSLNAEIILQTGDYTCHCRQL